jgi:uncharacterized protein YaiL (DUF2058 family)
VKIENVDAPASTSGARNMAINSNLSPIFSTSTAKMNSLDEKSLMDEDETSSANIDESTQSSISSNKSVIVQQQSQTVSAMAQSQTLTKSITQPQIDSKSTSSNVN